MTNEQIRDLELIMLQPCPDQGELLRKIMSDNKYDMTWAILKGYLLGYMHGKRADRSRRAQSMQGGNRQHNDR